MLTQYTKLLEELYTKLRRGYYRGYSQVLLVHGVYKPDPGVYIELLSWVKPVAGQADVVIEQRSDKVAVGYYVIDLDKIYDISQGVWVKRTLDEVQEYIEGLISQTKESDT